MLVNSVLRIRSTWSTNATDRVTPWRAYVSKTQNTTFEFEISK